MCETRFAHGHANCRANIRFRAFGRQQFSSDAER